MILQNHMKKIIHNLRNRPEEQRRHILHIIVFIFAIILITLWIYSLGTSVASKENKKQMKSDLQPFNLLKNSITNTTNNN